MAYFLRLRTKVLLYTSFKAICNKHFISWPASVFIFIVNLNLYYTFLLDIIVLGREKVNIFVIGYVRIEILKNNKKEYLNFTSFRNPLLI